MAKRTVRIKGGKPALNIYEIDDDFMQNTDLKIKDFSTVPTEEWALFVMNNRNYRFSDFSNPLCNQDFKYDIVHGPVANDDMAVLFQQYEQNFIHLSVLSGRTEKIRKPDTFVHPNGGQNEKNCDFCCYFACDDIGFRSDA